MQPAATIPAGNRLLHRQGAGEVLRLSARFEDVKNPAAGPGAICCRSSDQHGHLLRLMRANLDTSKIHSISTGMLPGKEPDKKTAPRGVADAMASSPKTWAINSEKPLITCGCCRKSAGQFTAAQRLDEPFDLVERSPRCCSDRRQDVEPDQAGPTPGLAPGSSRCQPCRGDLANWRRPGRVSCPET